MRAASVLCCGLVFLGTGCRLEHAPSGRPAGTRTAADSVVRSEEDSAAAEPVRRVLRSYYDRLSKRSWPAFTQSFWRGGTVTTSWAPAGGKAPRLLVQSVDDFVRQARRAGGADRLAVFGREPVAMDVRAYGDIAQAWVVYKARSGASRKPERVRFGVDAFHLVRHEGTWRIVNLAFTAEDPDRLLVTAR